MLERTLTAPGKLFLSGEYAVLWGGTARIAAVGPRMSAQVRRRDDRGVHIVLEEGRLAGQGTPLGVRWEQPEVPDRFHFVARALDLVLRAHARETLGFEVAISPGLVGEGGQKLGLGGSARATVLAAEAARFILDERFDTLKLSLLAHGLAQGLAGSGGDVAAIFAGGVIRYRRYPLEGLVRASTTGQLIAALSASPSVDLWRLPAPRVSLAYAFTGTSASTPTLIREVESRWSSEDRARFVNLSDQHGQVLEDGLVKGDFERVREASTGLHRLLCTLGPLETEPMQRLLAIAASNGCAGKISGAGGGDGCILFAPDAQSRQSALDGLRARGFFAMPLELEPGLKGQAERDEKLTAWLGG